MNDLSQTALCASSPLQFFRGAAPFGEGLEYWRFLRWLYERVWTAAERPTVVVDLATAWLVDHKVLLPGITTLTRLVARVRERAAHRSWTMVVSQLSEDDRQGLERLLEVESDRECPRWSGCAVHPAPPPSTAWSRPSIAWPSCSAWSADAGSALTG